MLHPNRTPKAFGLTMEANRRRITRDSTQLSASRKPAKRPKASGSHQWWSCRAGSRTAPDRRRSCQELPGADLVREAVTTFGAHAGRELAARRSSSVQFPVVV